MKTFNQNEKIQNNLTTKLFDFPVTGLEKQKNMNTNNMLSSYDNTKISGVFMHTWTYRYICVMYKERLFSILLLLQLLLL
jgi:hypothetical protein